jgi:hypothetical protein
MNIRHYPLLALVAALLASCSSEKSSNGEDKLVTLNSENPSDTTNTSGSVTLAFGMATEDAAMALDETPTSKAIGDVTLNYAKFSIAKIKIKPNKEPSESEKKLDEQEKEREKKQAKDQEAKIEEKIKETEDSASLAARPESEPSTRPKRPAMEDLAEKRKELSEKVKEFKEQEAKRTAEEAKSDPATKFVGPYVYDAIAGTLDGGPIKADVTDGSYRRIQFQLKRNFSVAETEPLLGNVFALKGTVKVGDDTYNLEVDWHIALNFRLASDTAFKVAPGEENTVGISLDMAEWFDGIDWSSAKVDEASKTIFVNKNSNQAIMRVLHSNMKTSVKCGKDEDKDGKLKPAEVAATGEDTKDAASETTEELAK